ncbi:MAG: hypothetical protein Kow0059_19610 [Candidatus Sumerlaeia bacterium]
MPVISDIVPRKRSGDRWILHLSSGEEFELDAEIAVRERLAPGMNLSVERLEALRREDEAVRAFRTAMRWIALRRHTRRDIERRLKQKGFSPWAVSEAGERLEARDKLNPQEFAQAFVRDKIKLSLYGPHRLRAALREHGVPDAVIEDTLGRLLTPDVQRERLERLADKLMRTQLHQPRPRKPLREHPDDGRSSRRPPDDRAARARLIAALERQGYDLPLVIAVVDERWPQTAPPDGE